MGKTIRNGGRESEHKRFKHEKERKQSNKKKWLESYQPHSNNQNSNSTETSYIFH